MGQLTIMPPANKLIEMFNNLDKWSETLSLIDAIGTSSFHFLDYYTDNEMQTLFASMRKLGIKLTVENGALKEGGGPENPQQSTGEKSFNAQVNTWRRIKNNGGEIATMAFDEPLLAVLRNPWMAGYSKSTKASAKNVDALYRYAAKETAMFMKLVRAEIPGVLMGDIGVRSPIEPYPYNMGSAELIKWIDILNEECAKINTPRMDFFRIDPNWAWFDIHSGDPAKEWRDTKVVEDYCKSIGMPFSIIYWSSDIYFRPGGPEADANWYDGVMHQGEDYFAVGGKPDNYHVETWLKSDDWTTWYPIGVVPENANKSFTQSVLDLYNKYIR